MFKKKLEIDKTIQKSKPSSKRMVSLVLAMLLPTSGVSIMNIALPSLSNEFGVSDALVNWVVVAYLLAVTSLVLSAGALGDSFGKKRLLLAGISIFGIASFLCALSEEFWLLITFRVFQGVGAAFILSQSLSIVATYTRKEDIGAAMGLIGTTAALGTALGPVTGGVILELLDWSSIFWLMVSMSIVAYCFCNIFVENDIEVVSWPESFDFIGTLLLSLSCLFFMLSMTSDSFLKSAENMVNLVLSLFLFISFVLRQKKARSPLINTSVIRNPVRKATLLTHIFVDALAMSTLVVGAFYLTYALLLPPIMVGAVMTAGPLIATFSGYPAGKLVDYLGVMKVMFLGLILLIIGVVCIATLPIYFGVKGYLLSLIIITPARQLFHASNHTFVMVTVPKETKGAAAGILNLCKNLGLMTGASMMSGVFLLFLDSQSISLATHDQISIAFSYTYGCAALVITLLLFYVSAAFKKEGHSLRTFPNIIVTKPNT